MVHVQFKIDNMNMKKYKLGDLLSEFHAGKAIQTENVKNKGAYPVYGGNGQRGYTDSYNQDGEYLIIGRQGAYCGNVRYNIGKAYLTEHAIVGQAKENHNPIYIALKLSLMKLSQLQGQSAQPGLSVNTLSCISMEMPPKEIQDKIADIMLKLDRKIELNKQINDNLEAMAKQLYDYWFVQFDFPNEEGKPYKSSGGAMVWNEKLKREIPQGWSVLSVNDIAASVRGVSYAKDDMVDSNNGVLVLRGNNIQDNHLIYDSNVAYIPSSFVSEDQRIRPLDIIMTMSSGSKEHIGKSAMFQFASEDTFGAFLTKFTAKEHCAYLLFNLFNSQYFKAKIKSIACGTGINNLTNQTFDEIYIVMPEDELLLEFDKRQSQIFAEIGLIEKSNVELTKQRDELLPLLMNGQASVNYHLSVY